MSSLSSTKVIVGLSGGVDSAVAALRLLEQGYTVEGLFMKNWDEDDGTEYCTAKEDLADAQKVADHLGIRLHCANFAAEYWDNVFEYFLSEYRACRTPNPDILCNREIKFKVFLEYAQTLGADRIATGHYARILAPRTHDPIPWQNTAPTHALFRGLDPAKDQSYFLHALTTEQLARSLFPLGDLTKPEVRALAQERGLHNFGRKDSTGICFIGERRFQAFLERYCPKDPGEIWTSDGEIIGEHHGLAYYTIGQRQGLGIGGLKAHADGAWYVADKDKTHNRLIVAQGTHHPALFAQQLITDTPHWIHPLELSHNTPLHCHAKIRYRQANQACYIRPRAQNSEQGSRDPAPLQVVFDEPQRAITPGQFVVFYVGDHCLGGAQIQQAIKDLET